MYNSGKIGDEMILWFVGLLACASLAVDAAASGVGAADAEEGDLHPPCVFNTMCGCSRFDGRLLGVVSCVDTHLPKLPSELGRSKISSLRLINNGLKRIEPRSLSDTGLHMLRISCNPLYDVEADTFDGLESSLRDLELSSCELVRVPSHALRRLRKLQILNLSGNDIVDVSRENWLEIRNTLETLVLRENAIGYLPANAFEKFANLKVLDLSANILVDMDPNAFFSGTPKLTHLHLADNQLHHVPYIQLQSLRSVKELDLSYNFIENLSAVSELGNTAAIGSKFSLHSLHLEYNKISRLTKYDFQKFSAINSTYLGGNKIKEIQDGAFEGIGSSELSLAGCGLTALDARTLRGLERTLTSLDLSGNRLTTLDSQLLARFGLLAQLKTLGNAIANFSVPDAATGGSLVRLEVGAAPDLNRLALFADISRVKSLISLTISNVEIPFMASSNFIGYGFGVEEVRIVNAKMKSIRSHSFVHVRGLKTLDLSNNELRQIDENAFTEIGHSLNALYLSHAFAESVKVFPHAVVGRLSSLKVLDISYNSFQKLPSASFDSMRDLESVRIYDCQISDLKLETFKSDVHVRLKEVTLSFNQLRIVKSYTFHDLAELRYLNLEENLLRSIETRAFGNLAKLKWLYLRGNQLEFIEFDAFFNLPELELLDLSFNCLKRFDLTSIDEMVGSFPFLRLNVSFNEIRWLQDDYDHTDTDVKYEIRDLNIKILDLSHNWISEIDGEYFTPVKNSLISLHLSHNLLTNVSGDIFANLTQLRWLDFSFNTIRDVTSNVFEGVDKIQVINLRRNELAAIPENLFHGLKNLRLLDLSNNYLDHLPDYSFREDSLESVLLAHNRFAKIPFRSFASTAAASLKEIDLSYNSIVNLYAPEFSSHFKSLTCLNVSANQITHLPPQTFSSSTSLLSLDLSRNRPFQYVEERPTFQGLRRNLLFLDLSNTSLSYVPHLPFQKLTILRLSGNNLTTISPEVLSNLTSIRVLDLSRNNFNSSTIPVAILSMKNLKLLNLSRNSIRILSDNSLLSGLAELRELDVSHLPLQTFQTDTLWRLRSLRTLHISTYSNVHNFNVPKVIERNHALQNLHLHVSSKTLNEEMEGHFPKNLRRIVIYGSQLEDVGATILTGLSFPELLLKFDGTSLHTLTDDIFQNMQAVRNISVDVRNNALKYLHNPSSGLTIGLYDRTFLVDLKISRNEWTCECDIGWVETWSRVRRQIFCHYSELVSDKRDHHRCFQASDDLRMTRCDKKKSLLDVVKYDLECQWSRSSLLMSQFNCCCYFLLVALSHILHRRFLLR